MNGKKALVTGASSGIGKGIALALAAKGVDVALVGRNEARLQETAQEIAKVSNVKTICLVADVAVEADVKRVIEQAAQEFGSLDYLVNNAGVSQRSSYTIEEIESKEFERIMQTNVNSVLYCCREAMPYLKQSNGAYIINILSTAAFATGAGGGMYSASKYAARALHESLELSCKGSNVKVSAISPGPVNTNIWSHKLEAVSDKRKENMLKIENIADIVLFLLTMDPNIHIGNITVEPWFYVKGK